MPYPKFSRAYKSRRTRKSRPRAATTIQRAWRQKNRAKKSLSERTMLANRRAIRVINKQTEVKKLSAITDSPATIGFQVTNEVSINNKGCVGDTVQSFLMSPCGIRDYDNVHDPPVAADATPTGGGEFQRVGRQVTMHSISFKFRVDAQSAADNSPGYLQQYIDIYIVLDREPSNIPTVPNALTLLKTLTDEGSAVVNPDPAMCFYDTDLVNKKSRFNVLHRKRLWVESPDTAYNDPVPASGPLSTRVYPRSRHYSYTLKARYKLDYESDQNTTPQNQRVLVFAMSNVPASPHGLTLEQPKLTMNARFRFTDL